MLARDVARAYVTFNVSVSLDDICSCRVIEARALKKHVSPHRGHSECEKYQKNYLGDDSFLLHRIAPFLL
jgi:hypothetical protein